MANMQTTLGSRTYKLTVDGIEIASINVDIRIKSEERTPRGVNIQLDTNAHLIDLAQKLREVADAIQSQHTLAPNIAKG